MSRDFLAVAMGMMLVAIACDLDKKDDRKSVGGDAETTDDDESDSAQEPEEGDCEPGELRDCGLCDASDESTGGEDDGDLCDLEDVCILHEGVPRWECDVGDEDACACNTPLVISFTGAEPQFTAAPTAAFDLDVAGGCLATDWPTTATPWLAFDRDGDGGISDGRELFGSGTRLAAGPRARNGFAALAELDDNGDGKISAADPRFGELVLWSDHDGNKRGTADELQTLASAGVLSIELRYAVESICDDRGNCGVERAAFQFIGVAGAIERGQIVDVHLACQ